MASLPSALVPHLAERREKAAMVVEVRLSPTQDYLSNIFVVFEINKT